MQIKGTQGVALVTGLALLIVVSGIGALLFSRTLDEIRHSRDNTGIVQTLLLARGAANLGGGLLQSSVRDALEDVVELTSDTAQRWSYGTGSGSAPETVSVMRALSTNDQSVARLLQPRVDAIVCNQQPALGGGVIAVRIYFTATACGENLPGGVQLSTGRFVSGAPRGGASGNGEGQTYALPFVMVAEGRLGDYTRNIVLQGEYQFTVGRTSFALYALFTNIHRSNTGSDVWFTSDTLFDGPVHTNQFFRYFHNPWFGGRVTSAGCRNPTLFDCQGNDYSRRGAQFYGQGFVSSDAMVPPTSPSYTNAWGTHAPALTGGVDWSTNYIRLPPNQQDQAQAALSNGLHFNQNLSGLRLWAADANGNELTRDLSGNWQPAAVYQYIESCVGNTCTTYRYDASGRLERLQRQGNNWRWNTLTNNFNGVIYVNGRVDRLTGPPRRILNHRGSGLWQDNPEAAAPALASFAKMTIATDRQLRVTGDLRYENPPCSRGALRNANGAVTPAVCDNLGAQNVLGIYTQRDDILIGHNNQDATLNAPTNVAVHAVLMTSEGSVAVENFNSGAPRGAVNLIGGVIQNFYGAFGTFNSSTGAMQTGYSRRFTYDQRMSSGLAPPFFPTVGSDSVQGVTLISFGQREQLY